MNADTPETYKERDEARARVEIITPNENNPVAEFFSSNTPETDAETNYCDAMPDMPWVDAEVARKLERERNEAREALLIIANSEPKNIGSILAQGFFDYHNLKKQEIDERRKKEAKE